MIDRIEKENCLIELPLTSEYVNLTDLTSYIKSELNAIQRNVPESILQTISKSAYLQLDKQSQIFFLLRLALNETYLSYLSQERRKLDFTNLSLDDVLNAYIGKFKSFHRYFCRILVLFCVMTDYCEQRFGPKICLYVFNYISSSQAAISEVELLDILSCNNELFLEYFPQDLPKYLRFPPSLWIAIKHVLGKNHSTRETKSVRRSRFV